jgi:hypothetical protein
VFSKKGTLELRVVSNRFNGVGKGFRVRSAVSRCAEDRIGASLKGFLDSF